MKILAIAAACCALAGGAQAAAVNGTGNVTPDVIFGSGNSNSSFTGVNQNGVELALRGKTRYDINGLPANNFNYNGLTDSYTFSPLASNPPAGRSAFNFEWSINVGSGAAGGVLTDLTYLLSIDFDPTAATSFVSFDPVNVAYADHAIGDNSTGNGGGTVAANAAQYQSLISSYNVAQNSWNMGFFPTLAPAGFDPQAEGQYTFALSAFRNGNEIASTSIDIIYGAVPAPVPLPAGGLLMAGALAGLGLLRRRKRN